MPELNRALLRLYGRDCDRAADNLPLANSDTLGKILRNRLENGDVLISFNYDTEVERLATRLGHDLRPYSVELRTDCVNFVKPHGSTSWCLDLNRRRVTSRRSDGGILTDSLPETTPKEEEPLVLGAVPIKSELIEEVQVAYQVPEVFKVVMDQWKAVVEALSKADTIVAVGYSFPQEDQYGRFLFLEAMRNRRNPPKVEFYELEHNAALRAQAIAATFLVRGLAVKWKGEVKGPSLSTWACPLC